VAEEGEKGSFPERGLADDSLSSPFGSTGTHLEQLHDLKTGRLIRASIECVVILGSDRSKQQLPQFKVFATQLGRLFQIIDDILDVTGSDQILGKPTGSDIRNGKVTYVSCYGLERARELASECYGQARAALSNAEVEGDSSELEALTDLIYSRTV
jgi:geranylgeranyl diphosphate synthase type II